MWGLWSVEYIGHVIFFTWIYCSHYGVKFPAVYSFVQRRVLWQIILIYGNFRLSFGTSHVALFLYWKISIYVKTKIKQSTLLKYGGKIKHGFWFLAQSSLDEALLLPIVVDAAVAAAGDNYG